MNYKKMIEDIDDIVGSDFMYSIDYKLSIGEEISQDDLRKVMTDVIKVYKISHQSHCEACRENKYLPCQK